jgi:hypothetical protein
LRTFNGCVHRPLVPHVRHYRHRATQSFGAGIEVNPPRVTHREADCRTFVDEPLDNATAEETSATENGHQCHIKRPFALRGLPPLFWLLTSRLRALIKNELPAIDRRVVSFGVTKKDNCF